MIIKIFHGVVVASSLLVAGCDGGSRAVATADCVKLRDRQAALTVERSAAHLSEEKKRQHRDNVSAGAGDAYLKKCKETMTVKALDCGLEARSLDELERCAAMR